MLDINKFGKMIQDLNKRAWESDNPVWFIEHEDLEDYTLADRKRLRKDVSIIDIFYPNVLEFGWEDSYLMAFTNFIFVFNSKKDLIDGGWGDVYDEEYGEDISQEYDRTEQYAEIIHKRLGNMWKGA